MAQGKLPNREGQQVPDVAFRIRRNGEWATMTTGDIFAGKNVVVFSLPGAFTPTCSSTHLPRYNELAPVFRAQGIDAIVCVSVNDPFVMEEWAKDQEADQVFLLPDGNGEFTEKMGLLVDKSELNFGKRSWRYSMLVRDRTIEKMFIEPQEPGDPFKVSDADTLLNYVNPQAHKPDQIAILTREGCSFCAKAKAQLAEAGLDYAEIPLPHTIRTKALGAIANAKTVPQVFVNGELIGGSAELETFLRTRAGSDDRTHSAEGRAVAQTA
jgi:glutaredoxin-like protein